MAARGSVGLVHAGRRKRLVVRCRFTAKSQNQAWAPARMSTVSIRFPGLGKSALSYAYTRRMTSASLFAHLVPKSQPSGAPPRVVSMVSRRSLLLLASVVQRNPSRLAGASRPHPPAAHPTHSQASASPSPVATRSYSATWPEGEACHPWARLPSPSRGQPQRHKPRALRRVRPMRPVARAMQKLLLRRLQLVHPSRSLLPVHLRQVHRTRCAACPCLHAIQLLVGAVASVQPPRRVLLPLCRRAVSRLCDPDKHLSNPDVFAQTALVRRSCWSQTARTTERPGRANRHLMVRLRRASAKTLLACYLPLPRNRVLERPCLAHATVVRLLLQGLAVPPAHAHRTLALAQARVATQWQTAGFKYYSPTLVSSWSFPSFPRAQRHTEVEKKKLAIINAASLFEIQTLCVCARIQGLSMMLIGCLLARGAVPK
jgi:hypothetical protein